MKYLRCSHLIQWEERLPPVKSFVFDSGTKHKCLSVFQKDLGSTQMRHCAIKHLLTNLLIYRQIFAACYFFKKGPVRVCLCSLFFTPLSHHQSRAKAEQIEQNVDFTCRLEYPIKFPPWFIPKNRMTESHTLEWFRCLWICRCTIEPTNEDSHSVSFGLI